MEKIFSIFANKYKIVMYTHKMTLRDNELPGKINAETGEFSQVSKKVDNRPSGKIRFNYDASFHKSYEKCWLYLSENLTGAELRIALMMSCIMEYSTNSLAPLDNNTSYELLSEKFSISKGMVKKSFKKLFDIGVYASFKYSHYKRGIVEEWVFNPFISFKGKLIDSDLKNLFINTKVARHFFDSV